MKNLIFTHDSQRWGGGAKIEFLKIAQNWSIIYATDCKFHEESEYGIKNSITCRQNTETGKKHVFALVHPI